MAAAPIAQTIAIFLRIVAEHALEEHDCGETTFIPRRRQVSHAFPHEGATSPQSAAVLLNEPQKFPHCSVQY
jgi:hypothetical protein